MDKIIYDSVTKYYSTLERIGYVSYNNVLSLLVLCFFRYYIYHDYRANISQEDYKVIEKALNCLFGSNCLIPYTNYVSLDKEANPYCSMMGGGKLYLGEMSELVQRIKNLENTEVLKAFNAVGTDGSDIIITVSDDE